MARFTPREPRIVQRDDSKVQEFLEADKAELAGKLWCTMTQRPQDSMDDSTLNIIRKSLDDMESTESTDESSSRFNNSRLYSVVKMASYVYPLYKDDQDVSRLAMVIRDKDILEAAKELSANGKIKPIPYRSREDAAEDVDQLLREAGFQHWTEVPGMDLGFLIRLRAFPFEDSLRIIRENKDLSFQEVYMRLKRLKTQHGLYPSVSMDNVMTREKFEAKKNNFVKPNKVDMYEDAREQEEITVNSYLDVDEYANDLLMQGASMEDVMKYHNDVPSGYWMAVESKVNDTDLDIFEIYDILEESFGFHPEQRSQHLI